MKMRQIAPLGAGRMQPFERLRRGIAFVFGGYMAGCVVHIGLCRVFINYFRRNGISRL